MNHCDRPMQKWGKDKAGYQRWRCPDCHRVINENPNPRGRPMVGDKPMTSAEKKRKSRREQREKNEQ